MRGTHHVGSIATAGMFFVTANYATYGVALCLASLTFPFVSYVTDRIKSGCCQKLMMKPVFSPSMRPTADRFVNASGGYS